MPFLSVTAHQTGAFRLCCRDAKIVESESLGDIKNTTIEKMRNSPKMKEFRLKMLNNQEIPECKVCYESQKK
jgi:radical SAM protein with 4Fe4S-binding SPASM domain